MIFREKWISLSAIVCMLGTYYYFDHYSNLTDIFAYFPLWKEHHYFTTVTCYILLYTFGATIAFPGMLFFAVIGGWLFGIFPGLIYALISITLGSTFLFLIVQSFSPKRAYPLLDKLKQGFQKNTLRYLLMLRLVPIIPSWSITLISSLLNIGLKTFITGTLLGVLPCTFIFTLAGSTLKTLPHINNYQDLLRELNSSRLLLLLILPVLASITLMLQHIKKKGI